MSVTDWADLEDNRVGPILRELAEAIEATDDPVMLSRISSRLRYMNGPVNSLRQRAEKARRS